MTAAHNFSIRQTKVGNRGRKTLLFAIPALVLTVLTLHAFQGQSGNGAEQGDANAAYAIGLWGDLPYSTIQATVGVPNLIADMNAQKLVFTVHDGDLKQ